MKPHERAREIGEALKASDEVVSNCAGCGRNMTKAEGGTVFTVCDACWAMQGRHGIQLALQGLADALRQALELEYLPGRDKARAALDAAKQFLEEK